MRVCGWAVGPELLPFDCSNAIEAVVGALGPDAAGVQAAWFRWGSACPPDATCFVDPETAAHVVVRFLDGSTLTVPVDMTADGPVVHEAFVSADVVWPVLDRKLPAAAAPGLGVGGPAELLVRTALPFCGSEEEHDVRTVRGCFFGAVLSGRAAELISRVPLGADPAAITVHRYQGDGPLVVYRLFRVEDDVAAWVKDTCALEVVGDDELIFGLTDCLPLPLE